MTDPTASVLLPCHNAPYIGDAVASVMAQTYTDAELLLVDDASTDDTARRADEAADGSIPLTLIRRTTDSGGPATPLNQAAEAASGEWYAPLFHDDRWHADYLETQLHALANAPAADRIGLQYTGKRVIDADGEPVGQSCPPWPRISHALFESCAIPTPSSCLIRAADWHAIGGADPAVEMLVDWDLYLRLWQRSRFASVDAAKIDFRQHGGQDSEARWGRINAQRGPFIEKHAELFERAGTLERQWARHQHFSGLDRPPWLEDA